MENVNSEDLTPAGIAELAERVGVKKATLALRPLFLLAVLGGAFIALGGNLSTVMLAGAQGLPWGVSRALAGVAFSLGLILVVVGGAELFTGNCLIVIAVASRRVSPRALARNWAVVYAGNFAGALATAGLIFLSRQWTFADGQVGALAVKLADHKCDLEFVPAFLLGVYCNALVCLAVWLSYGARSIPGKIMALIPPVAAFVAMGFEHCVANMYLVPLGLLLKSSGGAVAAGNPAITAALAGAPHLTWARFVLGNLLPVTLGNIAGGAVLVGVVYWLIYRHPAETGLLPVTTGQSDQATRSARLANGARVANDGQVTSNARVEAYDPLAEHEGEPVEIGIS